MKKVGGLIILGILLIAIPVFAIGKTVNTGPIQTGNFSQGKVKMISLFQDLDGDGSFYYYGHSFHYGLPNPFATMGDCNDSDANIYPGAAEIWYDNVDQNCDGLSDFDQDYDGYQDSSVSRFTLPALLPSKVKSTTSSKIKPMSTAYDCNDLDPLVHPGVAECLDKIDNDCDGSVDEGNPPPMGTYYLDNDTDTYGNPAVSTVSCGMPAGYANNNTDCNDSNNLMNPGMAEYCNGYDDDCDLTIDESDSIDASTWYADTDHDTYGNPALTQRSCSQPSGYIANNTDCNDSNNTIYPGAFETYYDGINSNCDTLSDYDQDLDGFDSDDYSGTDCNDTDNTIYPLATEIWYDGIDQNCDGSSDYDQDTDTYEYDLDPTDGTTADYPHDGYDCDDTDSSIGTGDFFECGNALYLIPYPYEPYAEGYLCEGECYDLGDQGMLYCNFQGHNYSQSTLCTYSPIGGGHNECEICNS